jgi:hypothetical protein
VTLTEAVASCGTLNMTLLAPEDFTTFPLYFNLLQSKFSSYLPKNSVILSILTDTIKSSVWTTGSSEGEACDLQRRFAWCPTGRMINESQVADARYWVTPPDGSASTKRCLELSYDASKGASLASAHCSTDKRSFICQVCV